MAASTTTTVTVAVVAFVAGTLLGTFVCGSGDDPTPPPAPDAPGVRGLCDNECDWPRFCEPEPAEAMLLQMREWAEGEPEERIEEDVKRRIIENVFRCLDPCLTGVGIETHVCQLQGPSACEELPPIHEKASQAKQEPDHNVARDLWASCADDLDSFPGGR